MRRPRVWKQSLASLCDLVVCFGVNLVACVPAIAAAPQILAVCRLAAPCSACHPAPAKVEGGRSGWRSRRGPSRRRPARTSQAT
eukprot:10334857-Alexandrium_andersonii.AAC.1